MTSSKSLCLTCNKDEITYLCDGCAQRFCLPDLQQHRQALNRQLDEIIDEHDHVKQTLNEENSNPRNSSFIEQIDEWEQTSIETIRRTAQEYRETVLDHTRRVADEIKEKLARFSAQLEGIREENAFNEIDLNLITNKLTEMKREVTEPSNISIRPDAQTLIHKLHVTCSIANWRKVSKSQKWKQHATTIAGGGDQGQQLDRLALPWGIAVAHNKSILIADYKNDRVVRWEWQAKMGTVIAGGNGKGKRRDQLNGPTDLIVDKDNHSIIIADFGNRRVVRWDEQSETSPQILVENIDCRGLAMDKQGFLYVSDYEKHEVRRWKEGKREGTLVAGGNGQGHQANQLNVPSFLFVDDEQSVYVSDCGNHRVMKWRKGGHKGVIVAGGNGLGDSLGQLFEPRGVLVDRWGQIYVADWGNRRVMRWREEETEGEVVVGGHGSGQETDQLSYPMGLAFDDKGNLYVADHLNHRIQKFDFVLTQIDFVQW